MMMAVRSKFEDLRTQTNIQYNSLTELTEGCGVEGDVGAPALYQAC